METATNDAPARRMGRPPKPGGPLVAVLCIKGTDQWKEWIDGLARHQRLPLTTLVDHALIEYARTHGYDSPVPDRT